MKKLVLVLATALIGATTNSIAQTPADPALCGPYPTNYKEIVTRWLNTKLIDPASARIEWLDEPKPVDMGKKGEHLYGYLGHLKVNARNRFGAYTGKQSLSVLIRDGEVIKGIGFGY